MAEDPVRWRDLDPLKDDIKDLQHDVKDHETRIKDNEAGVSFYRAREVGIRMVLRGLVTAVTLLGAILAIAKMTGHL